MRRPGPIVTRSYAATAPRPSASAVATARPTPEFARRYDVLAPRVDDRTFRQGWMVQTRLQALFEQGQITREERDIAFQWKRHAETITPSHVQPWQVRVDTSITATDSGAVHRVHAATVIREAAAVLGPLRVKLLEWSVLEDRSWAEVGRLVRLSDKSAKEHAVEAIQALRDWWVGEVVAPAPVLRFRNQPGSL
jgi:hypothetical protein